jgi:glycosyltransferase involved in cell wall biosynthesis
MRIAIDASRTTIARLTGTERYAHALISALITLNDRLTHPHTLILYFRDAPPGDLFPSSPYTTRKIIPFRRAWTHVRFAAALFADRPDLTWVPAHTLPFLFPGRALVTAHDLGYRYFPQAHPALARFYLDLTTRFSARRAARVVADSHATAGDLTRFYGTPPEKIRVIYPGVDVPPPGDIRAARMKYDLPERYFLFLGTLQPRKNIARLVAAFRQIRARDPSVSLVMAGGRGWLYDPAWTAGAEGVILPGYIDDDDKGALYRGALALVFPSLYEGFGFPVLEAMHCGTPVICSRSSSLPELAGDAALLIDPEDTDAIANAMQRLLDDAALRQDLITRGAAQARKFTWEAAGSELLSLIAELG